ADYAAYPAYGRQFAAMGIDPADPDAIVAAVCLTDPGTARERLHAYREAGAHLPVVYPVIAGTPDAGVAQEALGAFAP
ncbi:MAG TPA: hypothetical protein VF235_09200, partial [Actinomycetota bacterium]